MSFCLSNTDASPVRVLALDGFHGGSHRAFLQGWVDYSHHAWTLLTLPARKWKWRMRHAAVTFAEQVSGLIENRAEFDCLFCTDMLNLAEFRGLCPSAVQDLPSVVYFHENQLTYPQPSPNARDLHFAFSNLTTAMVATEVWFNSDFHREEFFRGFSDWLPRLPDFQPTQALDGIRKKSRVQYPGILEMDEPRKRDPQAPLTIAWVSRWEHDKNPDLFFAGLAALSQRGVPFRLNILGESYRKTPACFADAQKQFSDYIDRWGFQPNRDEYLNALRESDVVVSTADHEFFGIAILEAVAAGCLPVVPPRLAYPEVLSGTRWFPHDDSPQNLADVLADLWQQKTSGHLTAWASENATHVRDRFGWSQRAHAMDAALGEMARV